MPELPLRDHAGRVVANVKIDVADLWWASQYRWSLSKKKGGYARRGTMQLGEPQHTYFMHRELLGLKHGDERQVDHINRDPLDNRRSNLRIVTHSENHQNLGAYKGSSSTYRGVWFDARREMWQAEAKLDGVKFWIGSFECEEEAAKAVAKWRGEHMQFSEDAA